jgi:hypothetical protein
LFSVFQRGQGRPATAHLSLMCPLVIVTHQPLIQINLQALKIGIEFLSERDLVKLLQDGLVESLADPIGLRCLRLCLAVIDVIERLVELIVVLFCTPQYSAP